LLIPINLNFFRVRLKSYAFKQSFFIIWRIEAKMSKALHLSRVYVEL
jgi:hypothetical protein